MLLGNMGFVVSVMLSDCRYFMPRFYDPIFTQKRFHCQKIDLVIMLIVISMPSGGSHHITIVSDMMPYVLVHRYARTLGTHL